MPMASENGSGRRSVYRPTSGWSSEAVNWNARVMSPIWVKVRAYDSFSTGYTAAIRDWIVSLRR